MIKYKRYIKILFLKTMIWSFAREEQCGLRVNDSTWADGTILHVRPVTKDGSI